MTTENKRQLRVLMWTVITGMVLLGATKMAGQVVLRPEFEASQTKLEAKIDHIEGITKDVLCGQNPDHWRCQ